MDPKGTVVVAKGADLGDPAIEALLDAGITEVKVRSVLACTTGTGVCATCYGRSMATGKLVDIGEAVGPIAEVSVRVRLEDDDRFYKITIIPDDGGEEVVYDKLSKRQRLRVFKHDDGGERPLSNVDHVKVGQQLLE